MSNLAVKKGLEILASATNVDALRRLIVMTIIGGYLSPASTIDEPAKDDSLSALLSRLPTKPLGELAAISKGKTGIKDATPGFFPLVVTAEARSTSDHFDFEGPGVMIPMVSSTGHGDASLKRIHYQDGQYAVGSILAVIQPNDSSVLSARYLHAFLSAFKDELLVSRMVGTANVSLTMAKISDVPVPLLPIQGQLKIDELMTLCDRLEAEQADADAAHAKLIETLLGTLTQSTDAADLAANWQRLAEHFDTLFTTESSLDALKQTILQLAVMGKLVPQDLKDEPASELLKRIAQERARLEAEGVCKKSKPMPPVDESNVPFALPNGWAWARFPEVGQLGRGKSKHRPRNDPALFNPGIYPLVQTGEVARAGTIVREVHSKYSDVGLSQSKMWPQGTLCITIAANIADSAILGFDACFPDSVVGFVPSELFGDSYYFLWFMKTAREELLKFAPSTAQKNINLEILEAVRIPLPPNAEMQRIVAKVDELMALCDRLKADLGESRNRQERLACTLIESALEAA
ncbi:restriction endonuclease subunit S [Aromatoleum toluclasticum]|uniref:restriction endonuclease subunit S n=1 Tax=Aromatoleum toluclasticum TaxID=92003 RepID=UPI001D17ECB6|nr:restriction endonuclease subunit S [Aromatoleum toluclasticum]MCC4118617.1 restriction endonuclease subunit S [Aromatoleum toluclasticum]